MSSAHDICVSGSGAGARALALALSGQGWRVAWACDLEASRGGAADVRTFALNARSIELLARLRVWPALRRFATPVHEMRVRGDRGGSLSFSAWQQCVGELAWIVDAAALERLLEDALRYAPHVTVVPPSNDGSPPAQADLLVVCEGKSSVTREALGVALSRHDYGQSALAARLTARRPHAGVARQWFRHPDVLALLPFHDPAPGASYGLVWSLPREQAQRLEALAPADFEQALWQAVEQADPHAAADMGGLTLASPVVSWPLALAKAERWVGPGWVLLGDAAHQVHPLAGQGLNMGLADVSALVETLGRAREKEPWRSPGDERVLRRYARERWFPTEAMSGMTDGLLQLFSHEHDVVRELRNRGMGLLDHWSPVKRWLVGRALDA